MNTKRLSLVPVVTAACALCVALFVFAGFAGCDNPSTTPDRTVMYPAPNPGPSLTPGDGEIQVQFTSVVGADSGYQVFYNTVNDPGSAKAQHFAQSSNNLAQDFISGLDNGVPYYIWVEAWFGDGERSALTPVVTATPRAKPPAPGGFTATPNNNALDLMWDPVTTAAHSADSYTVFWSATYNGEEPPDGALNAVFYASQGYLDATGDNAVLGYIPNYVLDDDGNQVLNGTAFSNGTPYHVWIRAKNTTGESEDYAYVAGMPNQAAGALATPPEAPGLSPKDGALVVSFNAVKGATGYKLFYQSGSYNATPDIDTANYVIVNAGAGRMTGTITGLTNKTPYYVWVAAMNGDTLISVPGEPSNEAPFPPPPLNMQNASQVIGYATERFPNEEAGKGDRLSRKQETAIADMVTDAMWYWTDSKKGTTVNSNTLPANIDFAFVNGGVIVNALPAGPITVKSIRWALHSAGDQMTVLTMTGAQIKEFFNERVAHVSHSGGGGSGTGAFGQVSKQVRFTLNYHNTVRDGTIDSLKFNGTDFVDNQSYTFVTNTYLFGGYNDGTARDGYAVYFTANGVNYWHTNVEIAEAVCQWIYDENKVGRNIEPKIDGRLTLVNERLSN